MEETLRPKTLTIQRDFAPNRLAEEILVGVYDRVLQVATRPKDDEQTLGRALTSQTEHTTLTGGQS